jgi:hypothetical protein
MPADQQPGDSMVGNGPGTSTEGAAADVAATSTYAELQPGDSMTVTPSSSADIVAATPPPAAGMTPAPRPAETVARRMPPRVAYEMTTAFPSSVDDAGRYLIASRTHADIYYANAAVMTATFAYPSATDDAGRYLIASRTHADIYLDRTRFAQRSQTGAD